MKHILVLDERYALHFVSGGVRLKGFVLDEGFEVGTFETGSCGEDAVFKPAYLLGELGRAAKKVVGLEKSEMTCLAAVFLYAEVSFFVRSMKMDGLEDAVAAMRLAC